MKVFFALIMALLITLAPVVALADEASGPQVKVLVVFPAVQAPTKVYFATDGEFTRGMLIPFAAIANNINLRKRSTELGGQLDATIEGYDRYQILHEVLQKSFQQRSSMFALTKTTEESRYLDKDKPNDKAAADGHAYVLVIEDTFTGLSMLNLLSTRSDDVAPAMTIRFKLFDAKSKKLLNKAYASSNGMVKKHISLAPKDRELFVSAYPEISRIIATQVVGTLFRTDVLNQMAISVNRGSEVPKVSAILKRNEKRFSYKLAPIEGWKRLKMNSPYVQVLEPKSDLRYQMGIRFDVDLLIPEFGQDVDTVEAYLVPMSERLADSGIDISTLEPFSDITIPDGYKIYSYANNKEGGRTIIALRVIDGDMIEIVMVVITKDFDVHYPQYRSEIEKNIANTSLKVNSR